MAAAEANGRVCYGLEIDPKYCDVIIQRWQDMSGRNATLDADGRNIRTNQSSEAGSRDLIRALPRGKSRKRRRRFWEVILRERPMLHALHLVLGIMHPPKTNRAAGHFPGGAKGAEEGEIQALTE